MEKVGKAVGGSVSVYPANPGVNPPEYGGTRRAGFWFPWFRLNRGQKPEIKVPKFKLEFSCQVDTLSTRKLENLLKSTVCTV